MARYEVIQTIWGPVSCGLKVLSEKRCGRKRRGEQILDAYIRGEQGLAKRYNLTRQYLQYLLHRTAGELGIDLLASRLAGKRVGNRLDTEADGG